MTEEFKLQEIRNKPTKDLTSHEMYIRYKDTIKKTNKKNYNKYTFGKYVKKYADKNPAKIKAKGKSRYLPIPQGQMCQSCANNKATQRHHEDYSKPLEVLFVCRECHGELDRLRRLRDNGR